MPRALDPDCTFDIWLDSDADKSPRPTFRAKYLTSRECLKIKDLDMSESPIEQMFDALGMSIVGWSNMANAGGSPMAFSVGMLPDVLMLAEAKELLLKVLKGSSIDADLPKGSGLPSPSVTVSSATNVATASA